MSFETPVPAQTAALEYLIAQAARSDRPLRISGHSKGGKSGGLCGGTCAQAVQKRILRRVQLDGPGLDADTMESEGYARIKPVLHSRCCRRAALWVC